MYMLRFIFIFIILLAAVWLGIKIHSNPGYLLIAFQHWTIEMPLWLSGTIIIASFIVLYILIQIIKGTWTLFSRFSRWSKQRRINKAWQRTHHGLIALASGDWRLAEKNLIRAANQTDVPIINYLSAAYAAQQQEAYDRRDDYLREIRPKDKLSELALGITQARLQFQHNQLEQCLATLQRLQQLEPKHIYTLNLLQDVYLALADWSSLETLLPLLYKYKVQPFDDLEKLEAQIYEGLLLNAKKTGAFENVSAVWDRIPRDFRIQPKLLIIYVDVLEANKPGEAEQLLKNALQKQWDNTLIYWYGKIKGKDLDKQLKTAESWLKTQVNNPHLLFALGRLCIFNQLWGKARSYFEASLSLAPNAEVYLELAALLEQLNETNSALQKYKDGLMLACEKK